MEKMLNAFAQCLLIQYPTEDGKKAKEASDEQKEAFKEAVRNHLAFSRRVRNPGYVVTYDYRQGKIRGAKRPADESDVASPNGNLGSVLEKLPELPEGQTYIFPTPMFISFRIREGACKEPFEVISFCQWINSNLQ